jgi:plastocyanin
MRSLRRTYLLIPLIALLTLILAALACSGGTTATEKAPAEQNPPEATSASVQEGKIGVASIALMRDDGSGEPGDVVQSFTPADRKMHFEVKTTGLLSPGSKVKWVFTAVDTSSGQNIEITTVDTDVLVANNLTATLTLDKDWPTGSYKADVFINGNLFTTVEYNVEGEVVSAPAQAGLPGVEGIVLMRDDGSGEPGDVVQSFASTDRKIHFEVRLTDFVEAGTRVKWVFTAVDTTDGKNLEFQTIDSDITTSGNSLFANLELPNDWPTGSYKADVYVDDQLLTTVDYTVQ